jgi:hypothetical protein
MYKAFIPLVSALFVNVVYADWELVYSANGTLYIDNASIQLSALPNGPSYWQVNVYTDYMNAINDNQVCYPSGGDCQIRKLNESATFQFFCNQQVILIAHQVNWDTGGPISESYNPRTGSYESPTYSNTPPVTPPPNVAPGVAYNITGALGLLAAEKRVCTGSL